MMQPKRRRTLWIAGGVIVLALVAGGAVERKLGDGDQASIKVKRQDLIIGVEATGSLASVESKSLGPPQLPSIWQYKISQLATEGTEVKKGQPVLGFDTSELQRELLEKTAEADSARTQIQKRKADLELEKQNDLMRLEEARASLGKSDLKLEAPDEVLVTKDVAKEKMQNSLAHNEIAYLELRLAALDRAAREEILLLQGKLTRAETRVREINESIAAMTVNAPIDGTVILQADWRGEKKKIGDTSWRGETIVEIPDLNRMRGEGEIDEVESGKIRVGQKVTLRLDARPDEELKGTIQTIGSTVRRSDPSIPLKILPVQVTLENVNAETMRPGMRFRGEVELERIPGALVLPLDAIFDSPDGPVVYRMGALGTETSRVTLGKRSGDLIQILEGVDEGDKVVIRKVEEDPETDR